jgi:hypothetical protein
MHATFALMRLEARGLAVSEKRWASIRWRSAVAAADSAQSDSEA